MKVSVNQLQERGPLPFGKWLKTDEGRKSLLPALLLSLAVLPAYFPLFPVTLAGLAVLTYSVRKPSYEVLLRLKGRGEEYWKEEDYWEEKDEKEADGSFPFGLLGALPFGTGGRGRLPKRY